VSDPAGSHDLHSVQRNCLTRSLPTTTQAVTAYPFPGPPPTGMVTANLAHVPAEHVATHMHPLVSLGRLTAFNQHSQIKSHPTQPFQLLISFFPY